MTTTTRTITSKQVKELCNRFYEVSDMITHSKEKQEEQTAKYYDGQARGIIIGYEALTGHEAFIHYSIGYKGKYEMPLVKIYHTIPNTESHEDYLAFEYNVLAESLKAYNQNGEEIELDRIEIFTT